MTDKHSESITRRSTKEKAVQSDTKPRARKKKDHLKRHGAELVLVTTSAASIGSDSPLKFWTATADDAYLVDLTEFANGGESDHFKWGGNFLGRPKLIEELAPAIKKKLQLASSHTCASHTKHLRKWWRLLDQIETIQEATRAASDGTLVQRVQSVGDLGSLHGSHAVQSGMSRNEFSSFVSVAEVARRALGLKPLAWVSPDKTDGSVAVLAPSEDVRALYHGIKNDWHAATDRWQLARDLLAGPDVGGFSPGLSPACSYLRHEVSRLDEGGQHAHAATSKKHLEQQTEYEELLLRNIHLWVQAERRCASVDLMASDLYKGKGRNWFVKEGYNTQTMLAALYPSATDVRSAFHLCMSVGGLNPSVLTSLQIDLSVDTHLPDELIGSRADPLLRRNWVLKRCPFLHTSPIETEYLIEGWKDRSKNFVDRTYQWKQHLTPGPILVELVIRSWPLRLELIKKLEVARSDLKKLIVQKANDIAIDSLRTVVQKLESGVRSPWITVSSSQGISWLSDKNFYVIGPGNYLDRVSERINKMRSDRGESHLVRIKATDFRDAYAAWALDFSGGDVLAVMIALDHRRAATTSKYLNNTVVLRRVEKKLEFFQRALFVSFAEGCLDPTILALRARQGEISREEQARMKDRLEEYRKAPKSRYQVGCRDHHRPNELVDPNFKVDGIKVCDRHRCTLCPENAIITADAYPGLMLRQAELEILQERMPVEAFMHSAFDAELENTRSALIPYLQNDPAKLNEIVAAYKEEIRTGQRRVPEMSAYGNNRMIKSIQEDAN